MGKATAAAIKPKSGKWLRGGLAAAPPSGVRPFAVRRYCGRRDVSTDGRSGKPLFDSWGRRGKIDAECVSRFENQTKNRLPREISILGGSGCVGKGE